MGPVCIASLKSVEPGTPGTLAGLWGPGFCGGDMDGLFGRASVVLQGDED